MLMGAGLVATSAAALVREPRVTVSPLKTDELDRLIPTQFGRWRFETKSGLVLPPDDPFSDSLYSDILTRVYVSENAPPIMLLIAYSNTQNGMLQLHRPEVCYPAGGYTLSETKVMPLNLDPRTHIPARFFSAESASRTEQVLYWTRIGSESPTSWIDQRAAVVRANLKRVIPDGILVRVSSILPDRLSAMPVLEDFVAALMRDLTPQARELLFRGLTACFRSRETGLPVSVLLPSLIGTQDDPHEHQHKHKGEDGPYGVAFIAEIVCHSAAHGGRQILPETVSGHRLRRTLEEKDNKAGKYGDRNPVKDGFQRIPPLQI